MAKSSVALLLVKENSTRLPGKNTMDFKGKPMFLWNVEKCLSLFDRVYVSSDSSRILKMATEAGAMAIRRGSELCGDVPDVPVYQHALSRMRDVSAVVAVHANNPTISKNIIALTKKLLDSGVAEVMTCYPMTHGDNYHNQHNKIYGSIRGMRTERLENYPDPYHPNPEVLLVDRSTEIETPESFEQALHD
jgi:CMP-N-acetylneuraminic acid synthetase